MLLASAVLLVDYLIGSSERLQTIGQGLRRVHDDVLLREHEGRHILVLLLRAGR